MLLVLLALLLLLLLALLALLELPTLLLALAVEANSAIIQLLAVASSSGGGGGAAAFAPALSKRVVKADKFARLGGASGTLAGARFIFGAI